MMYKACCCSLNETVANNLGGCLNIAMHVSYDAPHGIEPTHCVSEMVQPVSLLESEVRR